MNQRNCLMLLVGCGLILAVEAPLVASSLAADLEGAYPVWEAAQASPLPESVNLPAAQLGPLEQATGPELQMRALQALEHADRGFAPVSGAQVLLSLGR